MNDDEARMVWQLVEEQRRSLQAKRLRPEQSLDPTQALASLFTRDYLPGVANDDLRVTAAMCWLGPSNLGSPPAEMRDALLTFVRDRIPDEDLRKKRIAEVAVAYGCGMWREVQNSGEGWEHHWQRALHWVTQRVLGWLRATASWLHFEVQLRGYAFVSPFPSWRDAEQLASQFRLGVCDCWRLRVTAPEQPPDHRTARRATRCLQEHRLSAWKPEEMTLGNFIARAMKGDKVKGERSNRKSFVSGAVEQGMFFCELYREFDLRLGRVLVWRCPHHPTDIFEEHGCLKCEEDGVLTRFAETMNTRDVVRRLLVKTPIGPYEEVQYWRCQQGDTYYQEHHAICPRCRSPRTHGAAKSTVWLLGQQPHQVALPSALWEAGDDLETQVAVRTALASLSPLQREILMLVKLEGRSERQAARQLGITREELQQLLEQATTTLHNALAEEEEARD
jgi:DNA-binding CsgD family transcriptional regulator